MLGASYLLRELLIRTISALVCCLNLDYITRFKIYRLAVFVYIMLFLLLSKYNISLYYTLSVVYMLSKFYSLFLVKRFISVYRCLRRILILGYIKLKPFKELKRAYLDTLII